MGARRAVRTAAHGWPSGVVGVMPPVRAWRVATGERARMVHGPAGQGRPRLRVQRDPDAGRCVTSASRATSRVWARLARFQFRLALFEWLFLQIFELRCYKQCIPKL
jgi:hypothetical protein